MAFTARIGKGRKGRPHQVPGRLVYVDKDNTPPGVGSDANPYASIQTAFDNALPGDRIRIRNSATPYDGTYTASVSGTASQPITVEPDSGHTPTLRYTAVGGTTGVIKIANVNYWTIQNLTFDGTGINTSQYALYIQGDNWFRSVTGDQVGIQVIGNTFLNWGRDAGASHDGYSEYYALHIGGGWEPPSPSSYLPNGTIVRGNMFDGCRNIAIALTSTKNSIVENNTVTNLKCGTYNDGSGGTALAWVGMHVISGTTGVGTGDIYRNNTFHDYNLVADLSQSEGSYTQISAIHIDEGPATGTIDGNIIYNLDADNTFIAAIAIFVELNCHGWTVQNNVISGIGVSGFRHNPQSVGTASTYNHNTIVNTKWRGIELYSGQAIVKNNISYGGDGGQIYTSANAVSQGNLTIDYNCYWDTAGTEIGRWNNGSVTNFATWKSNSSQDANAVSADPVFTNVGTRDFTLQGGSPILTASDTGGHIGAL